MEKHNLRSVIVTSELMGTVPSNSRRTVHLAAAFALSSGLVAVAAQPASAQMVVVPPGCGSYSGQPLPAGWTLDDHSLDAVPLGTAGTPHQVGANFGMITIGSQFNDVIQGNAIDEVICGLDGYDWLLGGSGNDEIFGGTGPDALYGEHNSDFLSGGEDTDTLFGDDPTNSHGGLDTGDTIQGGKEDDHSTVERATTCSGAAPARTTRMENSAQTPALRPRPVRAEPVQRVNPRCRAEA